MQQIDTRQFAQAQADYWGGKVIAENKKITAARRGFGRSIVGSAVAVATMGVGLFESFAAKDFSPHNGFLIAAIVGLTGLVLSAMAIDEYYQTGSEAREAAIIYKRLSTAWLKKLQRE